MSQSTSQPISPHRRKSLAAHACAHSHRHILPLLHLRLLPAVVVFSAVVVVVVVVAVVVAVVVVVVAVVAAADG